MSNRSTALPVSGRLDRMKDWLRIRVGMNSAIGFGLLSKLWSLPASFVTWYLMLADFSDLQRGFYSIFQSILAVQIFFELGLSTCISQFISHEFGNLRLTNEGILDGGIVPRGRVAAVFRLAVRWYAAIAIGFLVVVGALGWLFLAGKPTEGVAWVGPWWALCAAAAFALVCNPVASLLEGCGQIAFVARARFVGTLVASLLAWFGIKCGIGLMTAALMLLIPNVVFLGFCFRFRSRLIRQALVEEKPGDVSWMNEIWPFQWRIALSAASGFFILWFFNIPVAHYLGLEAAGRMGFTNQLVNALTSAAFMWVGMRAPQYGVLVGQRRRNELVALHRRTSRQAIAAYTTGSFVLFVVFLALQRFSFFANKLLSPSEMAILLIAGLATQIIFGQAVFLRAHKSDPFFGLSLINAMVTASLIILLTSRLGTMGACLAFAITQWTILVPATMVFRRSLLGRISDPI